MQTTLATIGAVTLPLGALIRGSAGAPAAVAAAIGSTLFYEYCHCIQHRRYAPKNALLQRIKPLHLLHHFHNENSNFGITNFFWDRVGCTYYSRASDVPRSMTVFNLGYADGECTRYPWVAQLSETRE